MLSFQVEENLKEVIMKGYFTLSSNPEQEPLHRMQFNVIVGVLSFYREYGQHILSPANRTFLKYIHPYYF